MNTMTEKAAPTFKPFEWVSREDQTDNGRYVVMSVIRDLASGVAVALQIIEKSSLDADIGDEPIISGSDVARLTRMSIAAMDVIEGYIDEHFDEMSERGAARRRDARETTS
jgi:hypothetical protein